MAITTTKIGKLDAFIKDGTLYFPAESLIESYNVNVTDIENGNAFLTFEELIKVPVFHNLEREFISNCLEVARQDVKNYVFGKRMVARLFRAESKGDGINFIMSGKLLVPINEIISKTSLPYGAVVRPLLDEYRFNLFTTKDVKQEIGHIREKSKTKYTSEKYMRKKETHRYNFMDILAFTYLSRNEPRLGDNYVEMIINYHLMFEEVIEGDI